MENDMGERGRAEIGDVEHPCSVVRMPGWIFNAEVTASFRFFTLHKNLCTAHVHLWVGCRSAVERRRYHPLISQMFRSGRFCRMFLLLFDHVVAFYHGHLGHVGLVIYLFVKPKKRRWFRH